MVVWSVVEGRPTLPQLSLVVVVSVVSVTIFFKNLSKTLPKHSPLSPAVVKKTGSTVAKKG